MTRHPRSHHRVTHRHWQQRRARRLTLRWPGWPLRAQDVDTHAPSRIQGKKRKDDRRAEERRFRQQVQRALAYDDPMPRYRHDYAD